MEMNKSSSKMKLIFTAAAFRVVAGAAIAAFVTADRAAAQSIAQTSASEAVDKVFEKHALDRKEFSVFARRRVPSSVRPLQRSTFSSLQKYFSVQQQDKVKEFLGALDYLVSLRDKHAKSWGVSAASWWPVNTLDLEPALNGDLLTDRRSNPDEMSIAVPHMAGQNLEITVRETYKDVASDGTNLGSTKEVRVIFVPETNRWVINEIVFRIIKGAHRDEYSLSQILRNQTNLLRKTATEISRLPKTPETRAAAPAEKH
jgi:hypothetical protein